MTVAELMKIWTVVFYRMLASLLIVVAVTSPLVAQFLCFSGPQWCRYSEHNPQVGIIASTVLVIIGSIISSINLFLAAYDKSKK